MTTYRPNSAVSYTTLHWLKRDWKGYKISKANNPFSGGHFRQLPRLNILIVYDNWLDKRAVMEIYDKSITALANNPYPGFMPTECLPNRNSLIANIYSNLTAPRMQGQYFTQHSNPVSKNVGVKEEDLIKDPQSVIDWLHVESHNHSGYITEGFTLDGEPNGFFFSHVKESDEKYSTFSMSLFVPRQYSWMKDEVTGESVKAYFPAWTPRCGISDDPEDSMYRKIVASTLFYSKHFYRSNHD